MKNNNQIYLILDNIRSAYNVGSLFRTADAAGVSKIYCCGFTPTPAQKTALGAENTVPWEHFSQSWRLIKKLKKEGFHIASLEITKQSINMFSYTPTFPIAIMLGNEISGVKKSLLNRSDSVIHIPMHGMKESLNVAVAGGIALYYIKNHEQRTSPSSR